jgi:hypothetical protein
MLFLLLLLFLSWSVRGLRNSGQSYCFTEKSSRRLGIAQKRKLLNRQSVISKSSCSIGLRGQIFVVKLIFVGVTATFIEEPRAHYNPGPAPQTGNRRIGDYDSFKQIYCRKSVSDK